MEERARYETGTGEPSRPAAPLMVTSLALMRTRLGFHVYGGEKIGQAQAERELANLTLLLHARERVARMRA